MAKPNPRATQFQVTHYIRGRVNYNDTNVATTGTYIGTIPAGAIVLGTTTSVPTAFNAATTNSLTIGGNSASYNNIATAAQTLVGSTGLSTARFAPTGAMLNSITADTDIFAVYQQTGTAASAGICDVMIEFTLNNDR